MKENIKKGIFVVFIIVIIIIVIKTLYNMYISKTNESFVEQSASPAVDTKPSQVKINNKLSGPYIHKNDKNDKEDDNDAFPQLTAEQQKCISKFTKECLSNLSPPQTEVYNSLISAPSEEKINEQAAYNTAVVSPK
jgi:uncharacterized membrane protein YhiD involved in acid resistance